VTDQIIVANGGDIGLSNAYPASTKGGEVSNVWFKPIPTDYTVIDVNTLPSGNYTLPSFSILKGPGKLLGRIVMSHDSWVVNCEGAGLGAGNFIQANAPNANVVNCYLHGGVPGSVGILCGGGTFGGLIYGNRVEEMQHDIYIQNDVLSTPRYVVHNLFANVLGGGNSYAIHAYTETANNMQGLHFYENAVVNGRALLGGSGGATPPTGCEFIGNVFYKSGLTSYYLPNNAKIKNNSFYESTLENDFWIPGNGAIITLNQFYSPDPTQYLHLQTQGNLGKLLPTDKVDHNKYFGHFFNALGVDGKFYASVTRLEDWHTYTAAAGAEYDTNGLFLPKHPKNRLYQYTNAYDASRFLTITENWGGTPEFTAVQQ
jgi:hypothetical protein